MRGWLAGQLLIPADSFPFMVATVWRRAPTESNPASREVGLIRFDGIREKHIRVGRCGSPSTEAKSSTATAKASSSSTSCGSPPLTNPRRRAANPVGRVSSTTRVRWSTHRSEGDTRGPHEQPT